MGTYQSVSKDDRIVTAPHLDRARRTLAAAELLHREGFHADAVVRAHQSTVHGERALLSTEKRSPTELWTVHRLATNHFLGNGQLDAAHQGRIEDLAQHRSHIDDQPRGNATADEAEEAIGAARSFLADVEAWLTERGFAEDPAS